MVIYQNMPEFNSFLSVAVPQTLNSVDRKRVATQVLTVLKQSAPQIDFKKAKCVDVGSSSGEVISYLSKDFNQITCLDVDKYALGIGKKKFAPLKNMKFVGFNGVNIPYANNSFEIVILRKVVEVADKPEELISEIYRVLKPGGLVYFESQNILWPDFNWDPFAFVPAKIKKVIAIAIGKRNYYIPTYKNYWQLKKMFYKFQIQLLTPEILKNPNKYYFVKLIPFRPLTKFMPLFLLNFLEPLNRHFIWVLKKNSD
jgi:ubiquinone/menaquinone biosynthesis C-methylase UbiE